MENYSDLDLFYLATHCPKAIFISCIGLLLSVWAIVLAVSNFKQIARMKTDCENHISEMNKFNEHKTFK